MLDEEWCHFAGYHRKPVAGRKARHLEESLPCPLLVVTTNGPREQIARLYCPRGYLAVAKQARQPFFEILLFL
jgi:hypothetical protein